MPKREKDPAPGLAADETPTSALVLAFHSDGNRIPAQSPDRAETVDAAPRLQAEPDDRAVAPVPLLGPRRTPEPHPRLDLVPGFVDGFVTWVLEQAPRPQPAIFQAVGLAVLGALTGRQFQTMTGARGNVFFLAIAGTGMGKDGAIGAARRLARAAQAHRYVAGIPGSFRGYGLFLAEHPARFFLLDELGKLMLQAQRRPESPVRAMLDFLLQLYSGSVAAGELPEHRIADQKNCTPAVPQPCTSLVGFSTEEAWEALTPGAASDGWLPRFLLVEGDPDVQLEDGPMLDPPPYLVRAVERIIADLPGHDYGLAGVDRMHPRAAPAVFPVPEDVDAQRIDRQLRLDADQWMREARQAKRPWIGDLVTRWRENGLKLAMMRAVSRWSVDETSDRPIVLGEDMAWGYAFAEDSIRRMVKALAERVGANPHDLLTKKIRRAIARGAGHEGWAYKAVLRRAIGGTVDTRTFDDAMRTLEELGDVERVEARARGTGAGRRSETFRLTQAGRSHLEG